MNQALAMVPVAAAEESVERKTRPTVADRVNLSVVRSDELPAVYAYIAARVGEVCKEQFFLAACRSGLAVAWRFESTTGKTPSGYLITLPLTQEGEARLLAGDAVGLEPTPASVARLPGEIAAIYVWALAGDTHSFPGVLKLLEIYSANELKSVPIYCRPTTERNARLFTKVGFSPVCPRTPASGLFVIRREAGTPEAPSGERMRTEVCRTLDDLHQIIAIRSVSYMAEQDCPFEEEFDGNDLGATHMIGRIDGKAVACIRARYFGSFVKIERLAVLPEFRRGSIGVRLAQSIIEFCRRKGFTTFYGHSADRVAPLWARVGFRHVEGAEPFVFSGITYREMMMETERHPHAITTTSGPYTIIRPEGAWDRPGVLG